MGGGLYRPSGPAWLGTRSAVLCSRLPKRGLTCQESTRLRPPAGLIQVRCGCKENCAACFKAKDDARFIAVAEMVVPSARILGIVVYRRTVKEERTASRKAAWKRQS